MATKGKRRQKLLLEKQSRKATEIKNSSGESKYAKKAKYLKTIGMFGFQILSPKPWRS